MERFEVTVPGRPEALLLCRPLLEHAAARADIPPEEGASLAAVVLQAAQTILEELSSDHDDSLPLTIAAQVEEAEL